MTTTDYNTRDIRRKLGTILLVIEFAFVLTAVIVAFGQGWPQVIQPLQVLAILIVMTVLMLIFQEVCNDFEETEKQHPGTYTEVRT